MLRYLKMTEVLITDAETIMEEVAAAEVAEANLLVEEETAEETALLIVLQEEVKAEATLEKEDLEEVNINISS